MQRHLAAKNLSSEELDLKVRGGGGGGENGGGDLPGRVGLLELDQPLVCRHPVTGLAVVVEDVHCLGHLPLQLAAARH